MQQTVGIACCRLQRVAEGMAKIQKRTVALLGLVAGHNIRFHLHRLAHRLDTERRVTGGHRGGVCFQPVEKRSRAKQPIFYHLAIACEKITFCQCAQNICVGQYERRLMKCAHKVFAVARVDPGLAAD